MRKKLFGVLLCLPLASIAVFVVTFIPYALLYPIVKMHYFVYLKMLATGCIGLVCIGALLAGIGKLFEVGIDIVFSNKKGG